MDVSLNRLQLTPYARLPGVQLIRRRSTRVVTWTRESGAQGRMPCDPVADGGLIECVLQDACTEMLQIEQLSERICRLSHSFTLILEAHPRAVATAPGSLMSGHRAYTPSSAVRRVRSVRRVAHPPYPPVRTH